MNDLGGNELELIHQGFAVVRRVGSVDELLTAAFGFEVRQLLERYGLVILRAIPISPQVQIKFSEHFGVVESLPFQHGQLREYPQIFRVSNQEGTGLADVGQTWHSDGAYLPEPRELSIFHMVSIPIQGGETEFVSLQGAYDVAPDELREQLRGKESVLRDSVRQPIVRKHPVSGRLGFYVKLSKSRKMFDTPQPISEQLFYAIENLLNREGAIYRHKWESGDILIADNYSVAHRALPCSSTDMRTLHRTTIVGGTRKTDLL